MASGGSSNYGIDDEKEKTEFFDSAEKLGTKLDQLAEWVNESEHLIFFTGAGISTSTGIPDFRSGMQTVLPTGPGVWELRDRGVTRPKVAKTTQTLQAVPSVTHMAIVQLQKQGIAKFIVSQNTDGLHLRSGVHAGALAELHGNTNLETCVRCKEKYLRDFRTRAARKVHDHDTGRLCSFPRCKGKLRDSIINFGESLPEKDLNDAFSHAEQADLCICLGSSLRVSPANEIPSLVAKAGKRVVIGNLQETPLNKKSSLVIHALCDEIMTGLMQRLKIPIPKWELTRRVKLAISLTRNKTNPKRIDVRTSLTGLDIARDISYSLFRKVSFKLELTEPKTFLFSHEVTKEPFVLTKETDLQDQKHYKISVYAEMFFHGNYGEPSFAVQNTFSNLVAGKAQEKEFVLYYDPAERKWRVGGQEA
eukprot:gene19232-21160_t